MSAERAVFHFVFGVGRIVHQSYNATYVVGAAHPCRAGAGDKCTYGLATIQLATDATHFESVDGTRRGAAFKNIAA